MNALANKVDVLGFVLVVQVLEFDGPLEKQLVGGFKLLMRDLTLIECPDSNNKLAVVLIVLIWEYPIEYVRSQTIEIEEEFPGLVPAREFLSWIARSMVK